MILGIIIALCAWFGVMILRAAFIVFVFGDFSNPDERLSAQISVPLSPPPIGGPVSNTGAGYPMPSKLESETGAEHQADRASAPDLS